MRLLVSVRDAAEAREAIAGGADVIDVKEPLAGPLGRAGLEETLGVAAAVRDAARSVPWTIACGELADGPVDLVAAHVASLVGLLPDGVRRPWLVKLGLAGAAQLDWERWVTDFESRLPDGVAQACVVYADWQRCDAPPPDRVVRLAGTLAGRTVLVDTFDKGAGGLFDVAVPGDLRETVALARSLGLVVALAGRIGLEDAGKVAHIAPDIVAVRSVACGGDRLRAVEAERVGVALRTLCRTSDTVSHFGHCVARKTLCRTSDAVSRYDPRLSGAHAMNDLEVRLPHGLSAEEMRVRLDRAVVVAREQYSETVGPIEAEWADEVMTVRFSTMGMSFNGQVESLPSELVVRVQLPMMASLFAGRIREGIQERLGRLIAS